ncbi:C1 family peptidase [Candidatus Altiarchaeota archaeon]
MDLPSNKIIIIIIQAVLVIGFLFYILQSQDVTVYVNESGRVGSNSYTGRSHNIKATSTTIRWNKQMIDAWRKRNSSLSSGLRNRKRPVYDRMISRSDYSMSKLRPDIMAERFGSSERMITSDDSFTLDLGRKEKKIMVGNAYTLSGSLDIELPDRLTSFMASGYLELDSPLSFARMIIEDVDKREYLVFASDGMYLEPGGYKFIDFCEETCELTGIIPVKIRIEADDARVYLDSFSHADKTPKAVPVDSGSQVQIGSDRGEQQVREKLSRLHEGILRNKMSWVAGDTSFVRMSYSEKRRHFNGGVLPNLAGFEAYESGVFKIPDNNIMGSSESLKTDDVSGSGLPLQIGFSWTQMHGKNWMTGVKDQKSCGSSWAHSAVASLEAAYRLRYNDHDLPIDLSEQDLLSDPGFGGCCGANLSEALDHLVEKGIVSEQCFKYKACDFRESVCLPGGIDMDECSKSIPSSDKCADAKDMLWSAANVTKVGESLLAFQQALMRYGPLTVSLRGWDHVFTATGFGFDGNDYYITVKNSWGNGWGESGYAQIAISAEDPGIEAYALSVGDITSKGYDDARIKCLDKDSDSYFTWGIGAIPETCPENIRQEADADDSDPVVYGIEYCTMEGDEDGDLLADCRDKDDCREGMACDLGHGRSCNKINKCGYAEVCDTKGDEDGDLLADCKDKTDCPVDTVCSKDGLMTCDLKGSCMPRELCEQLGDEDDDSQADCQDTFDCGPGSFCDLGHTRTCQDRACKRLELVEVTDCRGFQEVGYETAYYVLKNDIDCSMTKEWVTVIDGTDYTHKGFIPNPLLKGVLDGNGHTVKSIHVYKPEWDLIFLADPILSYMGIFMQTDQMSEIRNITFEDIDVTAVHAVGGLAGINNGLIKDVNVGGIVFGKDIVGGIVGVNKGAIISSVSIITVDAENSSGGIAGLNHGMIMDSYSGTHVIGNQKIGGIAGINSGQIIGCYANGDVVGANMVGGLVGSLVDGQITDSQTSGYMVGTNNVGGLVGSATRGSIIQSRSDSYVNGVKYVGGLVGSQYFGQIIRSNASGEIDGVEGVGGMVGRHLSGKIRDSLAKGDVNGNDTVGGLVGYDSGGLISNSIARGNVLGGDAVGGLIGSQSSGSILNSYATGNVTGEEYVGGLAGYVYGNIIVASYALGTVDSDNYAGALIGGGGGIIEDSFAVGNVTGNTSIAMLDGENNALSQNSHYNNTRPVFYKYTSHPINIWRFPPWDKFCKDAGFPSLEWEGIQERSDCRKATYPPTTTIPCHDTDGGINTSMRGTVIGGGNNLCADLACLEFCYDGGAALTSKGYAVRELWCDEKTNNISKAVINCSLGDECINGACAPRQATTTTTMPVKPCKDDDGGININARGSVRGGSNNHCPERVCREYCYDGVNIISDHGPAVREYWCNDNTNKILEEIIYCPEAMECKDGACIVSLNASSTTSTTLSNVTTTTLPCPRDGKYYENYCWYDSKKLESCEDACIRRGMECKSTKAIDKGCDTCQDLFPGANCRQDPSDFYPMYGDWSNVCYRGGGMYANWSNLCYNETGSDVCAFVCFGNRICPCLGLLPDEPVTTTTTIPMPPWDQEVLTSGPREAHVYDGSEPLDGFGDATEGIEGHMIVGDVASGLNDDKYRGLIYFNAKGICTGYSLSYAFVTLRVEGVSNMIPVINVDHILNEDDHLSPADYHSIPLEPGFYSFSCDMGQHWFDVTSQLTSDISHDRNYSAFRLDGMTYIDDTEDDACQIRTEGADIPVLRYKCQLPSTSVTTTSSTSTTLAGCLGTGVLNAGKCWFASDPSENCTLTCTKNGLDCDGSGFTDDGCLACNDLFLAASSCDMITESATYPMYASWSTKCYQGTGTATCNAIAAGNRLCPCISP